MQILGDLIFIWLFLFATFFRNEAAPNSSRNYLTSVSEDEFCSGGISVKVSPKQISHLFKYLRHCLHTTNNTEAGRRIITRLYAAATPVMHKAFFDGKTGAEELVKFIKLKRDAIDYIEDYDGLNGLSNRWKFKPPYCTINYDPANDDDSFKTGKDVEQCDNVINRGSTGSAEDIIKTSKLPQVSEFDGIIDLPLFNLSLSIDCDDVPYLILDTYVFVMRCVSHLSLPPEKTAEVSNLVITWLKTKVIPFVPTRNFADAYNNMVSSFLNNTEMSKISGKRLTPIVPKRDFLIVQNEKATEQTPMLLKLNYNVNPVYDVETPVEHRDGGVENEIETPKYSARRHFLSEELLDNKPIVEEHSTIVFGEEQAGEQKRYNFASNDDCEVSYEAVGSVASILVICCVVAFLLYWLLFGCCGFRSTTVPDPCEEECDDIDYCIGDNLEGKHRSDSSSNGCFCTLTEASQLDVIASLYSRCEQLSQKICQVASEISKENVFEEQVPFEKLRDFVRKISKEMINEEETLRKLMKLQESKLKLHTK